MIPCLQVIDFDGSQTSNDSYKRGTENLVKIKGVKEEVEKRRLLLLSLLFLFLNFAPMVWAATLFTLETTKNSDGWSF